MKFNIKAKNVIEVKKVFKILKINLKSYAI